MDEEARELIPWFEQYHQNSSPRSTRLSLFAELGKDFLNGASFPTRTIGLMEFDSVIVVIVMIVVTSD